MYYFLFSFASSYPHNSSFPFSYVHNQHQNDSKLAKWQKTRQVLARWADDIAQFFFEALWKRNVHKACKIVLEWCISNLHYIILFVARSLTRSNCVRPIWLQNASVPLQQKSKSRQNIRSILYVRKIPMLLILREKGASTLVSKIISGLNLKP